MSAEQSFSTQDLRAASQDYKRDSNSRRKWEHGESWPVGRQATAHPRPARPRSKKNDFPPPSVNQAKMVQRMDILAEKAASSDTSCDEEINEPMTASVPDADVTYSFDAPRGPSTGSQILGLALAKAVERFESNVTDKLVKDEYEVLNSDGESVAPKTGKKSPKMPNTAPMEEDDYEFV